MSLVWQQQATLASYTNSEYSTATFKAGSLSAIPLAIKSVSPIDVTLNWQEPTRKWDTQHYDVAWSPTNSGPGTSVYSGAYVDPVVHSIGVGPQSDASMNFTKVAAGRNHACGIARGSVYCWGSSTTGALGLGAGVTTKAAPTQVTGGGLSGLTVSDVTAGNDFTCAIAAGNAYCWGVGTAGQLGHGTAASKTVPTAVPPAVNGLTAGKVTAISAGDTHACAVSNGAAFCWGNAANGRLGNGSTFPSLNAPVAVTATGTGAVLAGRRVSGIAAGGSHSCAVADGRAFCWGLNSSGQVGDATTTSPRLAPLAVTTTLLGRKVTAITAGNTHTCAIADGKAWCWGDDSSGQVGHSVTTPTVSSPTAVTATGMPGTLSSISAGRAHTCAVADGLVYCWGAAALFGLGNNNATADQNKPVQLGGTLNSATSLVVSAGTSFGCATGNSAVSCWGNGASSQLGNGNTSNPYPATATPTEKACPDNSVRISTSDCSLLQGKDYYYNLDYSIGTWPAPDSGWAVKATTTSRKGVTTTMDGTPTNQTIGLKWTQASDQGTAYPEYTVERAPASDHTNPTTIAVTNALKFTDGGGVAQSRMFTQVSAGATHTCGIAGTQLYCWGNNNYGQLGIGSTGTGSNRPMLVTGLVGKRVTMVAAGGSHTCAIADDKVYCWGLNSSGELGDGTNNNRSDATIIPGQGSSVASWISAGTSHSCGMGSGVVYCWGLNTSGQLGTNDLNPRTGPTPVPNSAAFTNGSVTQVSTGGSHTCAVSASKAYCWGSNASGQLGNNLTGNSSVPVAVWTSIANMSSVTEVSAGSNHTCAVGAGKAYCWGSTSQGQGGNGVASTTPVRVPTPVNAALTGTVTGIAAGDQHTCAIGGTAMFCWGYNYNGQLGTANTTRYSTPRVVTTGGAFGSSGNTDLATGTAHSCSISNGRVYCWGLDTNGRLGQGGAASTANLSTPQATVTDALCAAGAASLGNGYCTLASGTAYSYRVKFTLDGKISTTGAWVDITTAG